MTRDSAKKNQESTEKLLSIVVPVYNEAEAIKPFLARLEDALGTVGFPVEILVIDDGSNDSTIECLSNASAVSVHPLRVIRLTRNFGKEFALRIGLQASRGDAVVTLDADLQHPPELISAMLELWVSASYPVVHAVKSEADGGWWRRLRSRAFYRAFRLLTGQNLTNQTDFKLLSREVVKQYLALPERRLFYRALIPWLGFRSASVEFSVPDRQHGNSRWSIGRLIATAADALLAFSARPLRLITWSAIIFLAFGVILTSIAVYQKLQGIAASGFTTVIIVLVVSSSVILFSLALLGAYINRIYDEVKARPRAIIDEESTIVESHGTSGSGQTGRDDTVRRGRV